MTTTDESPDVAGQWRPRERTRIEFSPRWVRAYFGGVKIAGTKRALLVFEPGRPAAYWMPFDDIRSDLMVPARGLDPSPALVWSLRVGDQVAEKVAMTYPNPTGWREGLRDHVAFDALRMDAWFEEEEEVFARPVDPRHRVDVRHSSRRVTVVARDQTVADTSRPSLLFETGYPTCFYLPVQDIRTDLLVPSDSSTVCPYKGVAQYWSLRTPDGLVEDVAWSYPAPVPESLKIAKLLSFDRAKVDIFVDGERPHGHLNVI